MKFSICLFIFSILTSVYAFSDPGAYERLWFWYAYTLDTTGNKIAPGCASKGKKCSFPDFMKYIDSNPGNMLDTLKGVDPLNVDQAVAALKAGHYTGLYKTEVMVAGVNDKNAVAKVMRAMTGFLQGNIGKADAQTKTALQQVTKAVAALRLTASLDGVTNYLKANSGGKITSVETGQFPVFTGSDDTAEYIDVGRTATTNGVAKKDINTYMKAWMDSDPGHSENIKASREGAAAMSFACS